MKILLTALTAALVVTGCTTRTELIPECKDGILHYTFQQTRVETGTLLYKDTRVLTYEDGSVVKCIEEKQDED